MTHLRLLSTLCGLCLTLLGTAQEIRFLGGYSGSQVREAGDEAWVGRAGWSIGADVLLGRRVFLRSGVHFHVRNLNYTVAGTTPDGTVLGNDVEFRYTSRSLRIPAHLGLRLISPDDDPVINFYIFGGPTAMLALSADLDNDELEVETRPAQWSIGFGGGLELGPLFAEVGYDVAMSNVFKGQAFRTNPEVNHIQALAGVRLRLAR